MVEDDDAFMARALALAERGRGRTSPNPMVGALVVDANGVIVGRGAHEFAGGPHAEINALAEAGDRAQGATLYCTLEPCSHTGRTGPCAPRVVAAGIRRAVIAGEDPNPKVRGRGLELLRAHGLDVTVGVRGDEAERINRPFFTLMRHGRPFVTMKAALSVDGFVAAHRGERTALTGVEANNAVHRERAEVDAIAVGSETMIVDDPLLTARGVYRYRPLVRVVFDRRWRTPPTARIFGTRDAGPIIIIGLAPSHADDRTRMQALTDAGAQLEPVTGDASSSDAFLAAALSRLGELGVTSLIVEGGPTLHDAFWRAGLVDRVELFLTSKTIGPDGVRWIPFGDGDVAALRELSVRPFGEDVAIEGYVHRPD